MSAAFYFYFVLLWIDTMQVIETTLIISIYNNLKALELIFISLKAQYLEVIIAEDNDSSDTKKFVIEHAKQLPFSITHLQQVDDGFRKCAMLNKAIEQARGEYLVFIDGDCILHPKFIFQHRSFRQKGFALYGRRVMISESLTKKLYQSKDLGLLSIFQFIKHRCQRLDAAWYLPFLPPKQKIGIWGHNWSIHKSDILSVAGYDDTYTSAGIGEDTDIEWRLVQTGIKFLRYKNKLVQYHLWHPENYQSTEAVQTKLEAKKENYQKTKDKKWLLGSLKLLD